MSMKGFLFWTFDIWILLFLSRDNLRRFLSLSYSMINFGNGVGQVDMHSLQKQFTSQVINKGGERERRLFVNTCSRGTKNQS